MLRPRARSTFSLPLIAFAALLAFSCQTAGSRSTQGKRYDIGTLLASLRLGGASISPDGSKILFASNQSGVINAYEVPFAGGAPVALTRSTTDAIQPLRYFPNDERVLYDQDQGGNELDHVFVRERDGTVRDLTPGTKLKAMFAGFAHDEKSFFVATNERDAKFFDVYEYATDGYARTELYRNEAGLFPGPISRDKRWMALGKPSTTNDSDVLLLDRTTGATKNVTEHTGTESNSAVAFMPDGRLLLATNRGGEFTRLVALDVASGARTDVFNTEWDATGASYSPDDRYLLVSVNADARTELVLLDSRTLARVPLPAVPAGDVTGVAFGKDSNRLAFYVASSRSPSSLWSADLATGNARQIVSALHPDVDAGDLVEGKVVRFPSTDGLQIPGILYVPHGASPDAKVPALVWVHGGPGGQSRLSYSPLLQYLVNHGFAVYAINNRGSSGYGKTFFAADDRKHGEADLDDVVASQADARGDRRDRQFARRHHGRQLRRLHDARRARVPARSVRGRRRHLRRRQLGAYAREHPAVVGGAEEGAVRGARRPGDRRRTVAAHQPAVPREEHQQAAARAAGQERPARARSRVGGDRRGREAERRAGRVRAVPRRGPRLRQARQREGRLRGRAALPPAASRRAGRAGS